MCGPLAYFIVLDNFWSFEHFVAINKPGLWNWTYGKSGKQMNWLHQWIHCNSFTSKSNVWKEKTFNVIQIVAMRTYQAVVFIWVYIFIWVCQSMGPWMRCVSVCVWVCVCLCVRDIKSELSYTCTNDHLYKTATCLRQSVLSPSKQILIKLLLYKTITCLTRPAATCFVHQMKKNCLNNHYKILPSKEMGSKHKATTHK